MDDTEDRPLWYEKALEWENDFCKMVYERYGVKAGIHPKKNENPAWLDLQLTLQKGRLLDAELKPMFVPFLKARLLYKVDPQFAFSFNVSDYNDYRRMRLKDEVIFLWVKFPFTLNPYDNPIYPMDVVYYARMAKFLGTIDRIKPPIHVYKRRVGRTDNSPKSFVFDVRHFKELEEIG